MDPLSLATIGTQLGSFAYNIFSNERNRSDTRRLQRQQWAREDSAIARRAADLSASGLNPLLAVGNPAASGQPLRAGGDAQVQAPSLASGVAQAQQSRLYSEQVNRARSENALIQAQVRKVEAETAEVQARTPTHASYIENLKARTGLTEQQAENAVLEYLNLQTYNNKMSAETALRVIERNVIERDMEILERLGLMKSPPGGVVGQAGQIANQLFTILDRVIGRMRGEQPRMSQDYVRLR